jgi:hypothetical protein
MCHATTDLKSGSCNTMLSKFVSVIGASKLITVEVKSRSHIYSISAIEAPASMQTDVATGDMDKRFIIMLCIAEL